MNEKEKIKYEIIDKVVTKKMTISDAMIQLNQTKRNINRLVNKYKQEGSTGFIHKNNGKRNINKIEYRIIEELENIYLNKFYDYNFTAFYEEIINKYKISYDVLLNTFKKDDIISPLAHKQTVKLYNENMNKAIKEENNEENNKIDLYKSRLIEVEKAHIRRSSNLYGFGQEVQMDACFKLWFGDMSFALHLSVDKGTKKVLFGWFEYEELTRGYFVLLYNIILNYGIPEKIKTDNRNSFSNGKNKVDTTQFGIICSMLGIKLVTTSVATAKSNVERENGTFKNRLIAELRHENIKTIDKANEYLNKIFIPKMNNKFSYEIKKEKSKMKQNNYTNEELNLIISERTLRIIDNTGSIKYNNKYYQLIDLITGEIICYQNKTKCYFVITYNGEYYCQVENNYYMLLELEERSLVLKKECEIKQTKENKKYIPPANHPWRRSIKTSR